MIPIISVLWIEDEGPRNMIRYATPVNNNPDYRLKVADNISDALYNLKHKEFDVIVLDLRVGPGSDKRWIQLNSDLANVGEPLRLGLYLLLNVCRQAEGKYNPYKVEIELEEIKEKNKELNRYCILTADLMVDVDPVLTHISFNTRYYKQKRPGMPVTILLDLIRARMNTL